MLFEEGESAMKLKTNAARIRETMIVACISVKELAEKSGLQSSTISRLTAKDRNATIKTVGKLAKALNIEPNTIIKEV